MLKFKKGCTVFLAVGLITAMCIPSQAGEGFGPGGRKLADKVRSAASEEEQYGHTTLSIFVARPSFANVSFTVPLTVTMAVEEGEKNVHVPSPSKYYIQNTSDGSEPFDIAVVRMEFTKLENSTYSTVEGPDVTGDRNILFKIGNVTMPAMSKPDTKKVTLRTVGSQFLENANANNYVDSKWKKITPSGPDNRLALNLEGKVAGTASLEDDNPGVDQFQVTYVISPLDNSGNPLGRVYAGDDHEMAGLGGLAP